MSYSNKYYCPMKCEGEKTYNKPGDCPVCNMHLVPVDEQTKNANGHHHPEHQHEHHQHKRTSASNGDGKYYCPMHCEGDKMYDEPGDCPVCGMHLKKEESTAVKNRTIYTCPMKREPSKLFWM